MDENQGSLAATLEEIEREKQVIIGGLDKQTDMYDVGVAFSKLKKSGGIYEFYINYFIASEGTTIFFPGKLESKAFRFSKTTIPYIRQKIEKELGKYEIYPPNNAPIEPDKESTHVSYLLEDSQNGPEYSFVVLQIVKRTVSIEFRNHRIGY